MSQETRDQRRPTGTYFSEFERLAVLEPCSAPSSRYARGTYSVLFVGAVLCRLIPAQNSTYEQSKHVQRSSFLIPDPSSCTWSPFCHVRISSPFLLCLFVSVSVESPYFVQRIDRSPSPQNHGGWQQLSFHSSNRRLSVEEIVGAT